MATSHLSRPNLADVDWFRAAWRRYLGSPARDAVFALGWGFTLLLGSYGEGHPSNPSDTVQFHGHVAPHSNTALLLVAVAGLVLAWRRRYPVPVLCASTAAVVVYSLLGYVNGAALLAPVLALYAVATTMRVRPAVIWGFVTLITLMAATAANNPMGQISGGGYYLVPAMVAAAVFGGIAVANRRAYVASLGERAEQDARRRLDEERLRIARELHDVVAHTMATINVQAGSALHVLQARPSAVAEAPMAQAAEALQSIKKASKDGLRELRAILNVLRQADEADPTAPTPGIAQLDTLAAGARQAGLETTLTVTGTPVPLPAAVDLAAYRIVQESLTNAIRHAGPATAMVALRYDEDALRLEVRDTGLGVLQGASGGHGLSGMRERATAVGGTVETGGVPGGGFLVAARLPVRIPSPDTEALLS
jgi:signal transduction histidine kinase